MDNIASARSKPIRKLLLLIAFSLLLVACKPASAIISTRTHTNYPDKTQMVSPSEKTPTRTPAPSRTSRSTSTNTPTRDLSPFEGLWKRYSNETYGISFEYPALYDEAPLNKLGCQVQVSGENGDVYFDIGDRIRLSIVDAKNRDLSEYVRTIVKEMQGQQMTIESQNERLVGESPAVTIEYRFGGQNRYGEKTIAKYREEIYEFDFTAGSDCIAIENDQIIRELDITVYQRILESFIFTQQVNDP